jgi:hypothetical protein
LLKTFLLPTLIIGWNGEGHKIIARIASSLVRRSTLGYLGDHLLGESEHESRLDSAISFASTWADSIVKDGSRPDTNVYHFVNIDDSGPGKRTCAPLFVPCARRSCIVSAIDEFAERASDPSLDKLQRVEALMFVIHLVGDAHHPLHTGFASDRGGSRIGLLRPIGRTLHQVWDEDLVDLVMNGNEWYEAANSIVEGLTVDDQEKASLMLPLSALKMVSNNIMENTCRWAYQTEPRLWIRPNHSLTAAYMESRAEIAKKLLIQAGIRLAQYLDDIAHSFAKETIASLKRAKQKAAASSPKAGGGSSPARPINIFSVLDADDDDSE